MFSYHPDTGNIDDAASYASGWCATNQFSIAAEVDTLAKYLVKYCTSPIIWKVGQRRETNFLFADWVALDFDEGLDLDAAVKLFGSFVHVIGTTRSHQKAKGDLPPVDRFRVWLRLKERCNDRQAYKDGVRAIAAKLKSDPKAACAARMFFPSLDLVSLNREGRVINLPKGPNPTAPPKRPEPKPEPRGLRQRLIPAFVMDWLRLGVPTGERNDTCFKVACHLTKRGFDEGEITDILMASSVPIDQTEKTRAEVASAVRNGAKRAATEM